MYNELEADSVDFKVYAFHLTNVFVFVCSGMLVPPIGLKLASLGLHWPTGRAHSICWHPTARCCGICTELWAGRVYSQLAVQGCCLAVPRSKGLSEQNGTEQH